MVSHGRCTFNKHSGWNYESVKADQSISDELIHNGKGQGRVLSTLTALFRPLSPQNRNRTRQPLPHYQTNVEKVTV